MANLTGKTIAILATDGFEQSELLEPRSALQAAGAGTKIVSLKVGTIRGWAENNWGKDLAVDLSVDQAKEEDFECASSAWRRHEPGPPANQSESSCVRTSLLRCP